MTSRLSPQRAVETFASMDDRGVPEPSDAEEKRARLFRFIEAGATEDDFPSFAAAINDYVAAELAAVRAERDEARERVEELEKVAVEARAALGSLCYDLEDPGSNAFGALYLLSQVTAWTETKPDDALQVLAKRDAQVREETLREAEGVASELFDAADERGDHAGADMAERIADRIARMADGGEAGATS